MDSPPPPPRFQVLSTLGDGGMGTVYLATMTGEGGFEKRVALKVLKPELSNDPESVELFLREARLAARLNHPNIVQVFDGGLDQGNLYLVLEYVDGGDLEGVIRASRARGRAVSAAAVAQVGAQICEALCAMFDLRDDAGTLLVQAHRDVSPGNVLGSRSGVAKLSDFGVVRLRESKTAVGKVRGKWEYFPPELIHGHHDQRGDLFALGITLYKLAALKHPFAAATSPQHFERACRDEPDPIPGLPDVLWGILLRALTKDPDERYQTADEMAADLEAFVSSTHERTSPRHLARELFPPPPAAPAPVGAAEVPGADGRGPTDLFREFEQAPPEPAPARTPSRPVTRGPADEVRDFEELFGAMPGQTPSQALPTPPPRESSVPGMVLLRGPMSTPQLRGLYQDFSARYRAHRGVGPPASFEQLALMVHNRYAQILKRYPGYAVSVSVVLENDRVIVRLRPVDQGGANPA